MAAEMEGILREGAVDAGGAYVGLYAAGKVDPTIWPPPGPHPPVVPPPGPGPYPYPPIEAGASSMTLTPAQHQAYIAQQANSTVIDPSFGQPGVPQPVLPQAPGVPPGPEVVPYTYSPPPPVGAHEAVAVGGTAAVAGGAVGTIGATTSAGIGSVLADVALLAFL